MRKLVMKSLAALLALALLLTVLPATATTAQAANVSSNGYVIFEETFDTNADGSLKSGNAFTPVGNTHSFANGCLTYSASNNRHYLDFTIPNINIPQSTSSRCFVGLKVELMVHKDSGDGRNAFVQLRPTDANGASVSFDPDVTVMQTTSGVGKAGKPSKKIDTLVVRVGARDEGEADTVIIEGVRVVLAVGEISGKTAVAQDMGRFLEIQNGYFQLQRDMTFDLYTRASDNATERNLYMGSDAVLDLNGHTLTIAGGSTLNAAGNAKIIDSSAEKTGKIVCAENQLTIVNSAHPTLPLRTADGYVFVEPKLIADTHIMVVEGSQTADKFTLHFRPGFGTLGNVNVRETYLAGGNSGIQMSVFLTSVDIYGKRTNLQYEGREEIILDNMFDAMYASPEARGQMTFQGFEKYQALEITLKLTAGGTSCILPLYTVNNTKVTKLFASKFATMDGVTNGSEIVNEQLKITNTANIKLSSAIATGAGKTLVMEFDASLSKTQGYYDGAGFEVRGANVNNSPRYYLFSTGTYAQYGRHHYIAQADVVGGKHVRVEVNLENFSTVYTVDGVRSTAAPAAADLENYIAAWNGKDAFNVSGANASNPLTIDNLIIYTIAS